MIYSFKDKTPKISKNTFLADGVKIIGDVELGEETSIWYNTVIRGDMAPIKIGKRTNIQDMSMIHVNRNQPTIIEDDVTVGHSVILHGCTIKRSSLIGMGSIILNGAVIEEESMVAAGSLVTENKVFPPRVLIMGSPAKVVRELTEDEVLSLKDTARRYVEKASEHQASEVISENL